MVFPISTDAPIYHWPIATVGMIVANVVVFIAMISGGHGLAPEGWILTFGDGLHPTQWLTSMFSHGSFDHLLGNMFFLWVFGLVVEGKLGALKFLACYIGIGVTQAMLEQVVMLGYHGDVPGSLGASSAIFGLMAMAAIWAPQNEITFFYFFIRVGTFDVSILMLSFFYTMLEVVFIVISGTDAGTSFLHLSGFAVGLPLGIVLLRTGVVDCEGWDFFHVWRGDYGGFKKGSSAKEQIAEGQKHEQSRNEKILTDANQLFKQLVAQGNHEAAARLVEKMKSVGSGIKLSRDDLLAVIKGLHATKRWADSAPYMAQFISAHPQEAEPMKVKLAQICLMELQRPGKALDILRGADLTKLPEPTAMLAKKIAAKARQQQMEGAVELEADTW